VLAALALKEFSLTDPSLIKTIILISFFLVFVLILILGAMYDKTKSRWSYLFWGACLIVIAIFSIVGIELVEALFNKDSFSDNLLPKDKEQFNIFAQFFSLFKWAFVLISGGIGVNLCSHGIINSKTQIISGLNEQQLNDIESNTLTIKRMIIGLGIFMVIGFVALWVKV